MEGDKKFKYKTRKEKTFSVLIIFVSCLVVFFAFYQMIQSLRGPVYSIYEKAGENYVSGCGDGTCDQSDSAFSALIAQQKDTDGDGLNDYDELNTYGTSPYLADSDSDGISDSLEVANGQDPNCPAGSVCFNPALEAESDEVPTLQTGPPQTSMSDVKLGADELRQIFIVSGLPYDEVMALSDDEVMFLYNKLLTAGFNDATNQSNIDVAVADDSFNSADLDVLTSLTGDQIRQLMLESGVSEDDLTQVTDDELKALFLEFLASEISTE